MKFREASNFIVTSVNCNAVLMPVNCINSNYLDLML